MHITRALQRHISSAVCEAFAESQTTAACRWYVATKIVSIYARCPKEHDPKQEHAYYAKKLSAMYDIDPQEFLGKTPEQLLKFAQDIRITMDQEMALFKQLTQK